MKGRDIRLALGIFVISALALIPATPLRAQALTSTTNLSVPVTLVVGIPCSGDIAVLSGDLHVLLHITLDDAGGFHVKQHFQPQGISGFGVFSGANFQATGVTQSEFNGRFGFEETDVNNFRIIGQGPGNNFLVHTLFHITINANGDITAFVDNASIECK